MPTEEHYESGDYVLATKWSDGDPLDQWVVGFYDKTDGRGRHCVVDASGNQMRAGGFRRVKRISRERGDWLLSNSDNIRWSGMSLWHFARCKMF